MANGEIEIGSVITILMIMAKGKEAMHNLETKNKCKQPSIYTQ